VQSADKGLDFQDSEMKVKKFRGEVLSGHKEDAVEVPFDPAEAWGVPPRPIWRGRRGHAVSGTLNGCPFEESFIVPRAKRFFMLIDRELKQAADVSVGDSVRVALEPKQG
jgi:Domain of unknown function (DUF1905)